jgi:cyclic beta-1,2-glucan synthetase
VVHVVALSGNAQTVGPIQYETDRSRFLGRGRSVRDPAALDDGAQLSGRVG